MTFEEIEDIAEKLLKELGVGEASGVADKTIGMGNYKEIMAVYQQIMNDVLVLVRETAANLKPADNNLPKAGTFND